MTHKGIVWISRRNFAGPVENEVIRKETAREKRFMMGMQKKATAGM